METRAAEASYHRLIAVTGELSSCRSVKEVLDTCVRHLAELGGTGACGVYLLNVTPQGRTLEPVEASQGWQARLWADGPLDLELDGYFRQAVDTGRVMVIDNADDDPCPERTRLARLDIQSLMILPLTAGGSCIGVLAVPAIGFPLAFGQPVQRIGKAIADATAMALQNAMTATHLEELVQLRTAEVSEANAKLEGLVAELRSLDRMKSDFIATVSHELRTPLHIIRQVVDLSLQGILGEYSPLQLEYLGKLETQVKNLSTQVEDLLDLSKIESGGFKIMRAPVHYAEIVGQALGSLELAARKKNIQLGAQVPPELVITVDRHRIEQVLLNLLSNAVKFTPEGGRVQVEVAEQAWGVVTSVRDTGIGIPERELERIFDKFYQVNASTTRRYGGTGLGLAITRKLVELHGGTLGVESEEGVGSAFTFVLPRKR